SPEKWANRRASKKSSLHLKMKDQTRARTLQLNEKIKVLYGKSGGDNLKLLRAARAWDYWVHLRDEPGSHGLVVREKSTEPSDREWQQIFQRLVEESFGARATSRLGDRMTMIICEVRHVRPIKGDKLGRVNFQNEKNRTFVYS
ncbi:MAG: DUF814 domain-containing protein, partial [Bdellovibrionales bacterium]|nr:DUF814 domain-containing protein [Bdellovibrionales bacterium]